MDQPQSDARSPQEAANEIGLARHAVSRRMFLHRAALLGAGSLLAACGGSPPVATESGAATTSPPVEGTTEAGAPTIAPAPAVELESTEPAATAAVDGSAETPQRGGVYRVLSNEQFGTLDAARAYSYMDWWLSYVVLYNTLYKFNAQGQLVPELAEGAPEASADGLTYTVKLRPGVKFHNGREMTADDVKFSFDRCAQPAVESPGVAYLSNVVGFDEVSSEASTELSGVKVIDPTTVEFTLKQPQSVFPAILAVTTFGIIPKQEVIDAGKEWGITVVIGTGPFKLAEWRTNELVALDRNPDYFKEGKPYLDRIEVKLNVKDEVGVLQWENGEAEFIYSIPSADLARIRADATLSTRIRESSSHVMYRLQFANNVKPFDDLRVRQAVAMSIDKENLARRSQSGRPLDGIYTPGMAQYNPNFKTDYPYDPEKAKQLLQEAGVAEGFKMIFWSGGTNRELGEAMQADLQAIGLEPELLVLEGSSYDAFKDRLEAAEFPVMTWGFGPDYPDGSSFVSAALVCGENPFPYQWCDPQVAELSSQVTTLPLNDPKRTEVLQQIEQIVVNEKVHIVSLYARSALILGQDYVHGDMPDPMMTLPLPEDVWMDPR